MTVLFVSVLSITSSSQPHPVHQFTRDPLKCVCPKMCLSKKTKKEEKQQKQQQQQQQQKQVWG